MGKTFSIKVLFGIYLLLMAGKVFAFSCNVDGGSSIGAGTTSVYVNLDPVIQPGQNLVVDLSQHISCWNDYGGWYDTDHINLVQGSAFAGSLQSYKGSLYWNNVTYPFPLTTNTNVLDIGDKTPMPLPLKLYSTIRRGTFMKSALKKSVVSTSISLILASGMAAFAAHAADDVKLKATKTNVAFSDFTPTEYSTKGKPNIIVLTMDEIDGPQELHDCYRRSNSGNGTFAKVIAAIERLKSYQIEFNTLTVINNINVHYPLEVYHFLKSIGSKHMQFIELLETGTPNIDFSGHSENTFRIIDFSVPPTAYGKFMSTIFMQWVKNDVGEIFIRQFESFVSRFLGNGHTSCIFQESCKDNLVVESNGDIYECDHFVYPQYKIGNINKSELKTMNSVQLTAQKKRISAKCQQCVYKPICNGGCPKHRITKVNNETVSYFCEGYKILFSTMVPYMNAMVELAKNRVPLYHIMDVAKQMENN